VRDEAGDVSKLEVDLVDKYLQFTDTTVRAVMAPRVDMVGVPRKVNGQGRGPVVSEQGTSVAGL